MKTVSEDRQNNRKHYIQAYRKGYNAKRDIDIKLIEEHIGNIVDICIDNWDDEEVNVVDELLNYMENLIKNNGNEE